jgi:NADPH:quinone reductase-like Zn-dependent oxidoreductase
MAGFEHTQQGASAMKAIGLTGPDYMPRLFDIDDPVASPGGVVVEVLAASVNDFDRAAVEGRMALTRPLDPVLLGRDFVGRVTAVGDDVHYIDAGMYVAGTTEVGRSGTFADSVEVPAELLAPVPDGIDVAEAAGVGLAAITALDAVGVLGATNLASTVIYGPVSEVGGFALQLAKARGAVVAVVTPPAQADLAWALGADEVIAEGADAMQTIQAVRDFFGSGVGNAIHIAGDVSVAAGVLRPGGKFTSVTDTATLAIRPDVEYIPTVVVPSGHKLADLLFKVAAQRLRSCVGRTFSFDQAGSALRSDGNSAGGRIVLVR